MTPAQFEALRQLAEVRKTANLAALEQLLGLRRACEAEIEALGEDRAREGAAPLGTTPPEAIAARLRWAEARAAELRDRLGALEPRIRRAREAAALSLGKDRALGELRDRAARNAARLRITRHERDAPLPEERREDLD